MPLIDPATIRLLKEEGLKGFFRGRTLHAYVYFAWMKEYVSFARAVLPNVAPWIRNALANRYHAKVISPEVAENIVTFPGDIELHHVPDQVIPFEYARDIVIRSPREIAVIECACRAAAGKNCTPSQVCMIIGQPFVDFVLAKQPTARKLTQDEAVAFLQEQHTLGRVHTAWFKDACMGRFYAICNCCKCCCSGAKAMREWDTAIVAPSGFVAVHDPELCVGCGHCAEGCVYTAIEVQHGKAHLHYDACMGCGICVDFCANGAWRLERDEKKGVPLRLRELVADDVLNKGIGPRPRAFGQILKKLSL
jgi:NAD-dependent dihydropyrimidine dehydrogenase PreA subunit